MIWIEITDLHHVTNSNIEDVTIGLAISFTWMNGLKTYLIPRVLDEPSFFVYNGLREIYLMDKEKLKLIVRNLELLVDSLKAEIYSDTQSYLNYEEIKGGLHDYDEIFDDDDGYPD